MVMMSQAFIHTPMPQAMAVTSKRGMKPPDEVATLLANIIMCLFLRSHPVFNQLAIMKLRGC
jgi:hypothetical protein